MPRPRLHETTVEAITRLANHNLEIDAERLHIDERLRVVLHDYADTLDEQGYHGSFRDEKRLVKPYDVRGDDDG